MQLRHREDSPHDPNMDELATSKSDLESIHKVDSVHDTAESNTIENMPAPLTSAQMKAVRFYGKEDLRYEDIPEPTCGPGQIKIAPAWCGVCGSDLHEYTGGPSLCPTTPHPITGETVPITMGHEFSGIIEEIGDGVNSEYKIGDRVCVRPTIYDGTCGACEMGLVNCCYQNGFVGLSGWGGGFAQHCVLPEYCVTKLPDNVSLEIAALVEPLAVGWHAVEAISIKATDSALVLGGGPIGLAVIQALRAKGVRNIIVSEMSAMRKKFASEFGAHHVLDPRHDDIVASCRTLCDGQGVHVAFDAAGVQAGLDVACEALRARGTIINIAVWNKPATIVPNKFVFREKRYVGVATYEKKDFDEVVKALSDGRLDMAHKMITKRIEMQDILEEGFKTLINDKENQVKVLVRGSGKI